jgi:hypothetical protein
MDPRSIGKTEKLRHGRVEACIVAEWEKVSPSDWVVDEGKTTNLAQQLRR